VRHVLTADQRQAFATDGFVELRGVVPKGLLSAASGVFQEAWDFCEKAWSEDAGDLSYRHPILNYPEFVRFLDSPELLSGPRDILGDQIQLVQYFPVYQEPRHWPSGREREPKRGWLHVPERLWHRDFSFTTGNGDLPVMVTLILFLDDVTEEHGPTVVLPGSHLASEAPPGLDVNLPFPGERGVPLEAGNALFLNACTLHSHRRNEASTHRRGLVLMFAYWWVKPDGFQFPLPSAALEDAPLGRRQLLGEEQPGRDLHLYEDL
jgi:Phytanoyl-CoA dioxygenase (PhyH)